MAITTLTVAERLAARLRENGVTMTDEQADAFAADFAGDLTEWTGGAEAVSVALASKVNKTASAWNVDVMQRLDWWTGPADGGPNGDGLYPMINAVGVETMFPSLAKLIDVTAKGNAGWTAKTKIEPDGATRAVVHILDWVGGEGTKPATGYVAEDGSLVGTAAEAQDVFSALSVTLNSLKDTTENYRDSAVAARDEVRLVADNSSELFYAELAVIHALLDANGRGLFHTEDGKWRGDLGVEAGTNLSRSYDPVTGITTFSFSGQAPLPVSTAGVIDGTSELYALDQKILCGMLDAALKIWAVGLEDGSFYVPKLLGRLPMLSGLNGVQVSYDEQTGQTTVSLGTSQGVLPLAGGGSIDSSAEWSVDGHDAGLVLFDAARKVWAAGLRDGRFYVPKLLVGQLETTGGVVGTMQPSLDVADGLYTVQTVAGSQQIVRLGKANGQQAQLTTLGNNSAPFDLSDGSGFGYSSDRGGSVRQFWQPYGGGRETLMVSSSSITLLGNSRTYGLTPYMIAGFPDRVVIGQGGSGQKSPEIAARWTGGPVQVTIAGGAIPASGSVNVTALSPDVFWHWDSNLGAIHCVIAGVPGTLTFDNAATPKNTFVRDTAGSIVAVSTPVNATLDSGRMLATTSAAGAPDLYDLRQTTAIIAAGYNDLAVGFFGSGFTYSRAGLLANIADMIDAIPCKVKRFLAPNIYVGHAALVNGAGGLAAGESVKGAAPDAATSKAFLDEWLAYNAALHAAWPYHYVDMHGRLAVTYGETATVLGTSYTILNRTFADDGIHAGNVGNLAKVAIYSDEISQREY